MVAEAPSATVLVVDDDHGLLRLIQKALQREGYTVVCASSGAEVIHWFGRSAPDLMLLDLKLHDIECKELVGTLADAKCLIPFIVITGQGDQKAAVEMMKQGALDYLVKDVAFLQSVPVAVRRALARIKEERSQAWREHQAQLSQIALDQAHSGIMITSDTTDPQITYINTALTRLIRCAREQLVGQSFSRLEALTGEWPQFRRALASGEPFLGETQIPRRGGELSIADCKISRVVDSSGKHTHWAVLVHDVTRRKRTERRQKLLYDVALMLAGADYSLAEAAADILETVCNTFDWCFGELWSVDRSSGVLRHVCTSPTSGRFPARWPKVTAAVTFRRGLGVPGRVWALGKPVHVVDLPTDPHCPRAQLAQRSGLRSAFGFPILLRGSVLGVMVFFWRVPRELDDDLFAFFATLGSQLGQFIERRRAEKALRRSESNLTRAQQIAHVGSYDLDLTVEGASYWSIELFRILGLDPAGPVLATTEYFRRLVHPEDQVRVRQAFARAVKEGIGLDQEYRIIQPQGAIRHVHSIAAPVLGRDEKPVRLVGALHDITELKRLEKAVWQISEREQRRIGQDLHDSLGQQLTALELKCQSLKADLAAQPPLARQAAQIGQFLRKAIGQTRSLAHGLAAHNVETGGLQRALADLAQTTSALGRLRCFFKCPSRVVIQDNELASHLYRIAQEALNNALKHSQASEVSLRLSQRCGVLLLQIRDNGRGLRPAKKAQPGMGMQVMKHRAAMIGAELEVLSRPSKGVTVTCTLSNKT